MARWFPVTLLLLTSCYADPAYLEMSVACETDEHCADFGSEWSCAPAGYCAQPEVLVPETDGGDPDGGIDQVPGCQADPCSPPTLEITTPIDDALVSQLVKMDLVVLPGNQPIEEVFCFVVPLGDIYAVAAQETSVDWSCELALDAVDPGDFSVGATVVDVDGRPGTDIVFLTKS